MKVDRQIVAESRHKIACLNIIIFEVIERTLTKFAHEYTM